jgi:uncharacterized membrane protein YccF (DUF307 family)
MLRVACIGLWFALSASFAVSASIIGMPAGVVAFEIVRASVWIGLALGAFLLARNLVHDWRRTDNNESSV